MGIEIERKFLVTGDDWRAGEGARIVQGYLAREKNLSVRVRLSNADAWLTVKGGAQDAGRMEFEYAIPPEDARDLLALCPYPLIEKRRRQVAHKGYQWEVDEFFGDNQGLVVAEIELDTPNQDVPLPPWVGREVTDDPRYLNANLALYPYAKWEH